mmetsp:Transcript_31623/g.54521  ORF Transcript_31623/g.54521 Transcript_31623/m.54521 type:complete len:93 (-) Transcript_31623:64-342(-)
MIHTKFGVALLSGFTHLFGWYRGGIASGLNGGVGWWCVCWALLGELHTRHTVSWCAYMQLMMTRVTMLGQRNQCMWSHVETDNVLRSYVWDG